MYKVSVIIPIYNCGKYLSRCLDSIANQTLKDIQVIMINDGSTDNSGEICQKYVSEYPNFEYHYKKNGGTASARNVGLNHAKGEYIGFVDSDDYIDYTMFEKMYCAAKNNNDSDMVFNAMIDEERKKNYPFTRPTPGVAMEEHIFPELFPHPTQTGTFRYFDWGNCYKIVKRVIVEQNKIRFYEKSRRCEDLGFAFECTIHSQSYHIMEAERLYFYCASEVSKSRHYTKNMWQSISKLMKYLQQVDEEYKGYDFAEKIQYCILYFCVIVIKNEVFGPKDKERIQRIQNILDDKLCKETIYLSLNNKYNKEYTAIFKAMRSGSAHRVNNIIQWYAWKKKYVAPVLAKLRGK